jgi:hypothetical protein
MVAICTTWLNILKYCILPTQRISVFRTVITINSINLLSFRVGSVWGYNWATLLLGEINAGTWSSGLEESKKLYAIKYGHESRGTHTRERLHWRVTAKTENYRPDLSSERASYINKPLTVNI